MTTNTQAAEALKPCPFCGSAEISSLDDAKLAGPTRATFWHECDNCGANTYHGYADTAEAAIEAWNQRATPQQAEDGLPELPEPTWFEPGDLQVCSGYTADQMRAYAREAQALAVKPAQEALSEELLQDLWLSCGWEIPQGVHRSIARAVERAHGIGIKKDGTT
jgi:Lar family restriction alleviation protein